MITLAKEVERPLPIVFVFSIALPLAIYFDAKPAPWYYWLLAGLSWFVILKWAYDKLTYSPFKE